MCSGMDRCLEVTGMTETRLAWDCGDEILDRLVSAEREELRRAISEEVLAALQYHSTTDELDHFIVYMTDDMKLAIELQLPDCARLIDLREVLAGEIEYR